jgi:hypothetical protein
MDFLGIKEFSCNPWKTDYDPVQKKKYKKSKYLKLYCRSNVNVHFNLYKKCILHKIKNNDTRFKYMFGIHRGCRSWFFCDSLLQPHVCSGQFGMNFYNENIFEREGVH